MASRLGFYRTTPAVGQSSRSRKAAASAPPASRSDSESDELWAPEEDTPAPSHASAPALVEPTLALKYSEADLMRILKIFLETKGQEPKAEVLRERPLKAKVPDVYFGKSYMDCYHFCQQCEDYFEIASATGLTRTPFAASFLRGKINFRWHQYRKQLGRVSVPWEEFKTFFRKNLGDSRSFVDTIWSNIKRDSQYQLEEVQDWASHLEHLQSILVEFDADGALVKSNLIRFFREGLKPSIKAQIEPRSQEYDSWDELVKKTVVAKAKANLQPSYYSRDMDNRCPKGNRLSHTNLWKHRSSRDDHLEKEKSQNPQVQKKSTQPPSSCSPRPDSNETSKKKARKEKKKKYRREHNRDSDTPATGINTDDVTSGRAPKDMSSITCFNCDRTGHYARSCPKKRDSSKAPKN